MDANWITWDVRTGEILRRVRASTPTPRISGSYLRIAFSPDGTTLASTDWDESIGVRIFDAATGALRHSLGKTGWTQPRLFFTQDGRGLHWFGNAWLRWDVTQPEPVATTLDGSGTIREAVLSPDERAVLCAKNQPDDNSFSLFVGEPGGPLRPAEGWPGTQPSCLCSVGTTAAFTTRLDQWSSCYLVIWDLAAQKVRRVIEALSVGFVPGLALSPDGSILASGHQGSVRLWETATGKELHRFDKLKGNVQALAFSPDGKVLAASGDGQAIWMWNVADGQRSGGAQGGHSGAIRSMSLRADERELVTGGKDGNVFVWDFASGALLRSAGQLPREVSAVAISPDGSTIHCLGYERNTIDRDGKLTRAETANALALSRDGSLLATASRLEVLVRTVEGKQCWSSSKAVSEEVHALAFSVDGKLLACASQDPCVCVWDSRDGKQVARFAEHTDTALSVAFSPDGKLLASGDISGRVFLYELGECKTIDLFEPGGWVRSLAFSPDGKMLMAGTGAREGAAHAMLVSWELATRRRLHAFDPEQGEAIFSVAVTADGRSVLTAGSNGTVAVWDLAALPTEASTESASKWRRRARSGQLVQRRDALAIFASTEPFDESELGIGSWNSEYAEYCTLPSEPQTVEKLLGVSIAAPVKVAAQKAAEQLGIPLAKQIFLLHYSDLDAEPGPLPRCPKVIFIGAIPYQPV
jgi:WD40 repeat protein